MVSCIPHCYDVNYSTPTSHYDVLGDLLGKNIKYHEVVLLNLFLLLFLHENQQLGILCQ